MVEIILDPSIREWVVLPMIIIFGCSAMVRHYVTLLLKNEKMASVEQLMSMYVAPNGESSEIEYWLNAAIFYGQEHGQACSDDAHQLQVYFA